MNSKPSIKRNYLYSLINEFFVVLIPIFLISLLTRRLGPERYGLLKFAQSIIQILLLFASLGVPIYGTREIARANSDRTRLKKVFSEIVLINLSLSLLCLLFYLSLFLFFENMAKNSFFFMIFSAQICFSFLAVRWVLKGFEQFRMLSIINVTANLFKVILAYLLVVGNNLLIKYALIVNMIVLVSNLVIFGIAVTKTGFTLKNLKFMHHVRSIAFFAGSVISVTLYIYIDTVMLGYFHNSESVAYYSIAMRITRVLVAVIFSVSITILPRISHYITHAMYKEMRSLIKKSIHLQFILIIPICAGILMLSKNIIYILSGEEYTNVIPLLRIAILLLPVVSVSVFIRTQVLIPGKREDVLFYTSFFGLLINVTLNLILIPKYDVVGALSASFVTEVSVLILLLVNAKKMVKLGQLMSKSLFWVFPAVTIMTILIHINLQVFDSLVVSTITSVLTGSIFYIVFLTIVRDEIVHEVFNLIGSIIKR